jgi:hypothetical protein
MAHISELALFDYVAGKGDLTVEEIDHLKECGDCAEEFLALRRVVEESTDLEKTRSLVEEGELPLDADSPPRKSA